MGGVSPQELADDVQLRLDPRKFLHVLGVAHAAVALAMRHGVDEQWAMTAGLLHDRSKNMTPEEIEADLKERGIEIPEEDRAFPALWHGFHAAAAIGTELDLTREQGAEEIAEAVRLHSTADSPIGPLARILFIADFTEPGRDFPGLNELRRIARQSLEDGYRRVLEHKCRYMKRQGKTLSPRALRALSAEGIEL